jgi:hypothetical protein
MGAAAEMAIREGCKQRSTRLAPIAVPRLSPEAELGHHKARGPMLPITDGLRSAASLRDLVRHAG